MIRHQSSAPPRPLTPGDVVAAFCETLGEWAVAQVTDLDAQWKKAGCLTWIGQVPSVLLCADMRGPPTDGRSTPARPKWRLLALTADQG
jgi:hypothetical protein